MHIYFYDSFVNQTKFENSIAKIETRMTDLGLNGRIIRLGVMQNLFSAVENEIKRGAKSLVAVGDDNTFSQIINAVAALMSANQIGQNIPIGIIPIGGKSDNQIASALGMCNDLESCDILSARRVEQIDIGKANNHFFISHAIIGTKNTVLEIDENYSIEIHGDGEIRIINFNTSNYSLPTNVKPSPQDSILELVISTSESKKFLKLYKKDNSQSIFSFNNLNIINNSQQIELDNSLKVDMPARISIANIKIPIIVGKDRSF